MNIAVVLASGQGKRMGADKNKVLLKINRKPLIYYSIEAFQKSNQIDLILLVCKKEEIGFFKNIVSKNNFSKVGEIIEGGAERQDSAYNAVFYLNEKFCKDSKKEHYLLFHNGANPFITNEEIEKSIKEERKNGA